LATRNGFNLKYFQARNCTQALDVVAKFAQKGECKVREDFQPHHLSPGGNKNVARITNFNEKIFSLLKRI
jgi:hypothetical protein